MSTHRKGCECAECFENSTLTVSRADLERVRADLEKFSREYVMDGEGLIERALDILARMLRPRGAK